VLLPRFRHELPKTLGKLPGHDELSHVVEKVAGALDGDAQRFTRA
jgi:hypothetical protein